MTLYHVTTEKKAKSTEKQDVLSNQLEDLQHCKQL